MGYALIVGGGEKGLYSIQLDWGEEQKARLIAAYGSVISELNVKIAATQVNLDDAIRKENESRVFIEDIVTQAIADGSAFNTAFTALYTDLLKQYTALKVAHEPIRIAMRKLKDARAVATKTLQSYSGVNTTETRTAWCADFTEEAEGYVATLEIPGESDLILIKPGAPYPDTVTDGVLSARELMSPSQAYLNAAILPGWQKEKPTCRRGTISSVDYVANTANVVLDNATSSAQNLPVNQTSTLTGVPIRYMLCDSTVFLPGDRVVVQFIGQAWSNPRIVGFLDNPRPCSWPIIGCYERSLNVYEVHFYTTSTQQLSTIWAAVKAGSAVVEIRRNRGVWERLELVPPFEGYTYDDMYRLQYRLTKLQTYVSVTPGGPQNVVRAYNLDVNFFNLELSGGTVAGIIIGQIGGPVMPDKAKMSIVIDCGPDDLPVLFENIYGNQIGPDFLTTDPYECRVYVGASLVFNGAAEESGNITDGSFSRYGKAQGGIENIWGGTQALELNYALFSQTGD